MSKMKHIGLMMGLAGMMISTQGRTSKKPLIIDTHPKYIPDLPSLAERISRFKKDCLSGLPGKDAQFVIAWKEDSIPVIAYNLKRANQKLNTLIRKHSLEGLTNITDTSEWINTVL